MSDKFILLITNNDNSPYIVDKEGFFNNIVTMPSQIADTPPEIMAKVTHIYYDFDRQITIGDYQGWVNAIRHYSKKLFPGIPALKASEFFPIECLELNENVFGFSEMTHPSNPVAWCPEKPTPNDGWVLIFKDVDSNVSQPLMKDIFKHHKYVHHIFNIGDVELDSLSKFTGKIYIYNYCNEPDNAIRVADLSEQLTKLGREVVYHISVDFNQEQPTMQNNEELKYEPTTSEAKTTQIVYAFAEHLTERDRAFLKEVGEHEGVYLEVREQEYYSETELSRLVRGMSVPQLVLFFNVRQEQKEKIIDILRKTDVHGLVTFAQIDEYPHPPVNSNESKHTHFAQVLVQATRPPRDWFELMDKKHGEPFKFDNGVPSRLEGLGGDYEAATPENLPMTYEFEDAIRMIKTGAVAMRALNSPVDSFISATPASELSPDKFWSKFNKARAEKQKGGKLKVNSSFTRFLGGLGGVTMGWVPTNEEMWSKWVVEGTALFPTRVQLSEDCNELHIRYDLYAGRSVLKDVTAFAGPFHLVYDTIFDAFRNYAKVGFLTNAEAEVEAQNAKLLSVILNDMLCFHETTGTEFVESNIVMDGLTIDSGPYFTFETMINFGTDKIYSQSSAAMWEKIVAEDIEVLVVDLDAFEGYPLKDDILGKLNTLAEKREGFTWVALSINDNIEFGDEAQGVEMIDLGDGPQEA